MNLKRWFAWVCLGLVVMAEILLFDAHRTRDALQVELRATQARMHLMQDELNELRNSNAGLQAAEILRLRRQNQILTNQVAQSRVALDQINIQSQSNAVYLATARMALRLQQDRIEQIQTEGQQVLEASVAIIARKTCVSNLRLIDDAKQQWATDQAKPLTAQPTVKDLMPYFKEKGFPECPDGGTYSLNAVDEVPTCSVQGHTLPQ